MKWRSKFKFIILLLAPLLLSSAKQVSAAPRFRGRVYCLKDKAKIPVAGISVDGWHNSCADHLTGIPCDTKSQTGCSGGDCGGTPYVEACHWACKTSKASCIGDSCWNAACNKYIPKCTNGGKRCPLYKHYALGGTRGKNCNEDRIVKWLTWAYTDSQGYFEIHSANLGCLESGSNYFSPARNPTCCTGGYWQNSVDVKEVVMYDNITNKEGIDFVWVCPEPTPTPRPTATPTVTSLPTPTTTLSPTPTTTPTATSTPVPSSTPSATPTLTPYPTATPLPTTTPRPTATPNPTATPHPTSTPRSTSTPGPTITPRPRPRLTTTPHPTATPVEPPATCACWLLEAEGNPDLSRVEKDQTLNFIAEAYTATLETAVVLDMVFVLDHEGTEVANSGNIPAYFNRSEIIGGINTDVYRSTWTWQVPTTTEAEGLYYLKLIIHCGWKEGKAQGKPLASQMTQKFQVLGDSPTPALQSPPTVLGSLEEWIERLREIIRDWLSRPEPTPTPPPAWRTNSKTKNPWSTPTANQAAYRNRQKLTTRNIWSGAYPASWGLYGSFLSSTQAILVKNRP